MKTGQRLLGILLIALGMLMLAIDYAARITPPVRQQLLSNEDYEKQWQDHLGQLHMGKTDLNTAEFEELCQLPGVGTKIAANILEYRMEHDGFRDVNELQYVDGITSECLKRLLPQVRVSEK